MDTGFEIPNSRAAGHRIHADLCKAVVEKHQKYRDKPLAECECGGKLKKIISKNTFKLKKNTSDVGWSRDW